MNKKRGPWTIKSSIRKYKNPWIEVSEDEVIKPDGEPGVFGTVKMKAGVSVLPMDKDGFVYLTQEFHYALGRESIEAVSGGIDGSEKPLETAKRELLEEIGIEAKEWIDLGLVNPFTTVVNSPAYLFLARDLQLTKRNPETEVIKLLKVKFDDAVNMVVDSKITHGPSCVLILKAKGYLKK